MKTPNLACVLLLLSTISYGALVRAQAISPEAVSVSKGSYRGDVKTNRGAGAFKVIINKVDNQRIEGTLQFFLGEKSCGRNDDIVGSVSENGNVSIATTDKAVRGCERTFILKVVSATQLVGSLKGPRGDYEVTLTKE